MHLSESMLARIHIVVRTSPGEIPRLRRARARERASCRPRAAGRTTSSTRWSTAAARSAATRCSRSYGRRLPGRLPRRPRAAQRGARHRADGAARRAGAPRHEPLPAARGDAGHAAASRSIAAARRCRCPTACRCSSTWACACWTSGPTAIEPEGAPVWIHDFGLRSARRRDRRSRPCAGCSRRRSRGMWTRRDRERRLQPPGARARRLAGRRDHGAARLRQVPAPDRLHFQPGLHRGRRSPRTRRSRALLVELFQARASIRRRSPTARRCSRGRGEIEQALDAVASLDEDRILRQYLALIRATLRTNYFLRAADGAPKPYLSFKFDPAKVPELPEPRPMFEIFVYSPRVEGVHLRGGKVARGGLRWSDRPEDFRTEVLGLMKAQMVKNVGDRAGRLQGRLRAQARAAGRRPRGAAEGRHRLLPDLPARPARPHRQPRRAARSCRRSDVVRHDPDDPYLVVAADKGTATFSDIANAIAARVRLLARRRVRLRRLGRLRPQEDGHHRARRLGVA